ncbi:hypothetical protein, partial [uncultured Pseudoalteromonas sp.]|uniref:hypothetical protein n=1 Tax=uncultured Pseudoalteromonas sp. TaxID=114053 RepID=UPI0026282562
RKTQGVTLFRTADDEQVVAVERLSNLGGDEEGEEGDIEGAEGTVDGSIDAAETSAEDAGDTAPESEGTDSDE